MNAELKPQCSLSIWYNLRHIVQGKHVLLVWTRLESILVM